MGARIGRLIRDRVGVYRLAVIVVVVVAIASIGRLLGV